MSDVKTYTRRCGCVVDHALQTVIEPCRNHLDLGEPEPDPLVTIEMIDGTVCNGKDAREIVSNMRESSWGGVESNGLRGYMEQVSKRVFDWNGSFVRIDTYNDFLIDCAQFGIIKFRTGQALILGKEKAS